jgi:hypothetical protein
MDDFDFIKWKSISKIFIVCTLINKKCFPSFVQSTLTLGLQFTFIGFMPGYKWSILFTSTSNRRFHLKLFTALLINTPANICRMPNQRAPPAPAGQQSAKQQLRRRLAGQADLAQAARRAALQFQERFRRAPRTPQESFFH